MAQNGRPKGVKNGPKSSFFVKIAIPVNLMRQKRRMLYFVHFGTQELQNYHNAKPAQTL